MEGLTLMTLKNLILSFISHCEDIFNKTLVLFCLIQIINITSLLAKESIILKTVDSYASIQSNMFTSGAETVNFRNGNAATSLGQLRFSLYESSALANNQSSIDGVLILFDTDGNNGIDANDALNITNLDENFAINNNGVLLSIESRAAPEDQEEIQLEINTYRNTNYTIVAEGISMQDATAFLWDTYTGIYTEIPQTGTVNYSYVVDSGNPASVAGDRFMVVFSVEVLSVSDYDVDRVLLYPNPTNIGKVYLNVPLGMDDLKITIYDVTGKLLYEKTGFAGGSKHTIDFISRFSIGTYLIELSSQGKTITKKLIIN